MQGQTPIPNANKIIAIGASTGGTEAVTEERPREDRKTEIDRGGVEGVDGVVKVEPQLLVSIEWTGNTDQGLGKVGVDAPVACLVCIGESTFGDTAPDTHMVELVLLCA